MLQELKAILSCLAQPAFILENGKLLFFNDAAQRHGVSRLPEEITEAAQAQGQQTFAIAPFACGVSLLLRRVWRFLSFIIARFHGAGKRKW